MKLATYNINGIIGRFEPLLAWLADARPDVVCLQEIKCRDRDFPRDALEAAGYGAIWHGQGPHHGVAILARGQAPIEVRRGLPGDDADREARYLEAAIDGLLMCCLYLPNGNPQPGPKFDYKLAWFERLVRHARELWATDLPIALVGDFNVVPTDADIYNVRSYRDNALLQPGPRDAFKRLCKQGWVDALRSLYPDEAVYTFWDYKRNAWNRDAGLRIDHLLLSRSVAARLCAAGVDRETRARPGASDHAPVWVELEA
jgi:exodeoxyribonuclease-3